MDNFKKIICSNILYTVAFMFCSGTIMQAFLIELGAGQSDVYLYETSIQVIQFCVMALSVFFVDKIKSTKRIIANAIFMLTLLIGTLLLACIFSSKGRGFFLPILIVGMVVYTFISLKNTLGYRFPYEIIDMKDYGRMQGVSGILVGTVTFLVSTLFVFILNNGDFMVINGIFFVCAMACAVFAGIFTLWCKPANRLKSNYISQGNRINVAVFQNRNTWILLLPNFCRGIATGSISFLPIIAISTNIINTSFASVMLVILQIAMFISNFIFMEAEKKLKVHNILLGAGIMMSCCLPLLMLWKNVVVFLTIYFTMYVFMLIVDVAIPVAITRFISYEQIGAFSAVRMMIFTLGQAVAAGFLNFLEGYFTYPVIFSIVAVFQLICCISYYFVAKTKKEDLLYH